MYINYTEKKCSNATQEPKIKVYKNCENNWHESEIKDIKIILPIKINES
jgi:hypothetical protein